MSIGKPLREKREERKLSVADVSSGTRVNKKYIQALEDENFLLIPSQVYAKGFLKAYANFLGLDSKSLVDELVGFYKKREESKRIASPATKITKIISMPKMPNLPALPEMPKMPKLPTIQYDKNTMYIALLSSFVLIFLISVYGYVSTHQKRDVPIKVNPPAAVKAETVKVLAKKIAANSAEIAAKSKVEVKIETTGRSWITVTSGAKELYSDTLEPGMKLRFVGKEIKVKAGNGGAVKIYVDGNSLGLMGQDGVVSEKTYRASE